MLQRDPNFKPGAQWHSGDTAQIALLGILASIGLLLIAVGLQVHNPLAMLLCLATGFVLTVGCTSSFILDRISPLFHALNSTDEEMEQEERDTRNRPLS